MDGLSPYSFGETPLFSYLYFTTEIPGGSGTALVAALLRADVPAPFADGLGDFASEFEARTGEKLADESIVVGDPGPLPQAAADSARLGAERVTGFFIVRADTAEAARRLASDSPHVRHGGRVEVRAIEPT